MILLISRNFLKRDLKRFSPNTWDKFIILDVSRLVKKGKIAGKFKDKRIIEISSLSGLLSFLKKNKHLYLIDNTNNTLKELLIKLMIKSYKIKFIKHFGSLKPESSYINKKFSLWLSLKKILLSFLLRYILDIVLISGLKYKSLEIYLKGRKKLFFTHSFDFNSYLKLKGANKNKDNIVYLDQNFTNHPAFEINKTKPITNKSFYYKLENYLIKTSKANKCEVKIALHPSAEKKIANFSKKFKCYFDKTAELVRDSKFVVAHYTTAIAYPVLLNKPITFLTSEELISKRPGNLTKDLSKELGSKLINIDKGDKLTLNKKINKKKYKNFINNYIKHPKSNNKDTWLSLKKKLVNKEF